jgi:hypothetical protein
MLISIFVNFVSLLKKLALKLKVYTVNSLSKSTLFDWLNLKFLFFLFILFSVSLTAYSNNGPNLETKVIRKVSPVYPALAKLKRIEGKVTIGIKTNSDGTVYQTEFLEGPVVFKIASIDAVKQWVFEKSPDGLLGHVVITFQLDKK